MEKANNYQIAGQHYREVNPDYQHWDLVADTGMGYFEGQITKYIARWRLKGGRQDLEKAYHYFTKLRELLTERRLFPSVANRPGTFTQQAALIKFFRNRETTVEENTIFHVLVSYRNLSGLEPLETVFQQLLKEAK